jgi:multidrug efflux pump
MSLAAIALRKARFTLVAAVTLAVAGLALLRGFPSTEEPTVPVRVASVQAFLPGATTDRMERLVAQPLEEGLRGVDRVRHLETTIRPGAVFLYVVLDESTPGDELGVAWQRIRAKIADIAPGLPEGTVGPVVDDDFGRVAVRSIALHGAGFSDGQREDAARRLRDRLQGVDGVERVTLHGVRPEQVVVELSPTRLAAHGLDFGTVGAAVAAHNRVLPSGELTVDGHVVALDPLADLQDVASLARVPVPLPDGGSLPLGALGELRQQGMDPPATAAFFDGEPAVVLGISMKTGQDVQGFARGLDAELAAAARDLPAGLRVDTVTDQAAVVADELGRVGQVFLETVAVVMAVVVLFLGWRAGLVTGAIVPLTVLGTLAAMRVLGIDLHQVSIAAVIISLGLFVDNGIVTVEDFQRRIAAGEPRLPAAEAAGRTMAAPLLTSTLAIIFAFLPLAAGANDTAEYLRSLAVVLAITLLLSLFLALTVIPVLAARFGTAAAHDAEDTDRIARLRDRYVAVIDRLVRRPWRVVAGMVALLAASLGLLALLPTQLLSPSSRAQLQVPVELAPGTGAAETRRVAGELSARLASDDWRDRLAGHALYVGDGGPRFILGLDPPVPAPHLAYAVVNVRAGQDLDTVAAALRVDLGERFPQLRAEPKRFSLGTSEAGTAVFRLRGPDRAVLDAASERLRAALAGMPGVQDVRDDGERRVPRLAVVVDPLKSVGAGLTIESLARTLDAWTAGVAVTQLRQGDVQVPVLLRAPAADRASPERLVAQPVPTPAGFVAIGEVATLTVADQASVLKRRDGDAVLTVTARGPGWTAAAIVAAAQPAIAALRLPDAHRLEIGGEIEESIEANAGLVDYFPVALLGMAGLFLWQFGSLRRMGIVLASIPFVLIGATLGLAVTGQALSFTATLGLLALAGIIVNNAVLLLERVNEEHTPGRPLREAVVAAARVRFRPIVMTKLTCVAGLVPLFAFGGELWRPLAAVMIGGLSLGTLITLLLIPALVIALFTDRAAAPASPATEAP